VKDKNITLLVGVPGSGKTWATNQLSDKYHVVANDAHIGKDYAAAIVEAAHTANKPVLCEAPFSISQVKDKLQSRGFRVKPVFIIEADNVLQQRYSSREGRNIPQGHITRQRTYRQRAADGGHFAGTSSQVLEHLKK
jgi:hypothetical protein